MICCWNVSLVLNEVVWSLSCLCLQNDTRKFCRKVSKISLLKFDMVSNGNQSIAGRFPLERISISVSVHLSKCKLQFCCWNFFEHWSYSFFRMLNLIAFLWSCLYLHVDAVDLLCVYKHQIFLDKVQIPPDVILENTYSCIGTFGEPNNKKPVTGISGSHLPENVLEKVQALLIRNQIVPKLPKGLTRFFQEIVALDLYNLQLRSITREDLRYPKLKLLHLGGNELVSFDSKLIRLLPHLEFFGANNNPTTIISDDIFDFSSKLKVIWLWNTCLKSFNDGYVGMEDGKDKLELLKLRLKKNCIKSSAQKELVYSEIMEDKDLRRLNVFKNLMRFVGNKGNKNICD